MKPRIVRLTTQQLREDSFRLPDDLKNYCAAEQYGDSFAIMDKDEAVFFLVMLMGVAAILFL